MLRVITLSGMVLALASVLFLATLALAQAQVPPAVPGLAAAPVSNSTDKLDVSWNSVLPSVGEYVIQWKSGYQTYSSTTRRISNTATPNDTSHRITGLEANTGYVVQVSIYNESTPDRQLLVRSETIATTNSSARWVIRRPVLVDDGFPSSGIVLFRLNDSVSMRLQAATGNGPFSYALTGVTGELPDGLTFDAETHTISGTPTETTPNNGRNGVVFYYKVTDANDKTRMREVAIYVRPTTEMSSLSVIPPLDALEVLDVSWTPAPDATGYQVQWKTGSQEYSNTVRNETTSESSYQIEDLEPGTKYTVRVTQQGGRYDGDTLERSASTRSTRLLTADTKPRWVDDGTFDLGDFTQEYVIGAVVHLTLPEATGEGTLAYSLAPHPGGAALPDGLTFNPETRKVAGVPTTAQAATGYRYTVTDGDGDKTHMDLLIAVDAGATQHPYVDDILIAGWTRSPSSGVTGYLVQWKTGNQEYSTTERSHTAGPKDYSYEVSDLALGVHTVKVTQQGGAGDGTSVEYTATLHGWPGDVFVDPVAGDARAINVEWETVSTAAGYVIEWKLAYAYVKPVSKYKYHSDRRAVVAAESLTYRTFTHPTTGETMRFPTLRVSGLQPNTMYDARVTVYTEAGSAELPDGLSDENFGTTHGELTGLAVSAVDDEPTKLDVSWTAPVTSVARFEAEGYRVQWKTDSGDYSETNSAPVPTGTSHTIDGLEAGTEYTVRVTVLGNWYGIREDGDSAETGGMTAAPVTGGSPSPADEAGGSGQQSDSAPAVSFVIYYDPDAGADAVDRYNQAVALLDEAGIAYGEVVGDIQDEASRLAGVTDSIIPRFFLGDPTSSDWVSQPKVNNGGLRWLKQKVAELSGD